MRKIICRFGNEEDLNEFSSLIGIGLDETIKEINMINGEVKYKKRSVKKGMKNIDWKKEWVDMIEWREDFADEVYAKIDFYFDDNITKEELSSFFRQNITDRSTSVWYPKLEIGKHRDLRVLGGRSPKYPIYVVSKGRNECKSWHTSFRLSQMGVKHYLVVEPQEYDMYCENFNNKYVEVIKMDLRYKDTYDCFSDLGNTDSCGPGAVRNFVWDLSIKNGDKYHWVLDDNIDGFNIFWRGHRLLCRTGEVFRSAEEFVERYSNIAIGGLNYMSFAKSGDRLPPYVLNTRIYSMLLIKNDIPYRWRGRYNEDTDLSLRVLKDGLCTIQFNLFLGEKLTTQKVKGGNTDEFYSAEGTSPKSRMLYDMHPDVTKLVWKFGREHHYVDYKGFKQPLIKSDNYNELVDVNNKVNSNGIKIIRIPRELCNTENDNYDYLMEHYYNNENSIRVDNTKLYL